MCGASGNRKEERAPYPCPCCMSTTSERVFWDQWLAYSERMLQKPSNFILTSGGGAMYQSVHLAAETSRE